MSENIFDLSARASKAIQEAGFTHCNVHCEDSRELAFHFEDDFSAHAFLANRELQGMKARIEDDNPTVVIVIQP